MMIKRKMLTIALMPVVLSGLLFFMIQITAVSGSSVGSHAIAPPEVPLLHMPSEEEPVDLSLDIFHVKPNASGGASCSDWDNACTLQTALGIATPGDEIWVQEGVYTPVDGIGYASCQEIRDAFPDAANGDYLINNGGDVFQVYCDNMDSTPVEYLTLRSQDANFAQYTAGGDGEGTGQALEGRLILLPCEVDAGQVASLRHCLDAGVGLRRELASSPRLVQRHPVPANRPSACVDPTQSFGLALQQDFERQCARALAPAVGDPA